MTTKEKISIWFDNGVNVDSKWMIVVYDNFDNEDYPVYVDDNLVELGKRIKKINSDEFLRVMEVYNLLFDKETQLNLKR